jgi:hypothetical protein
VTCFVRGASTAPLALHTPVPAVAAEAREAAQVGLLPRHHVSAGGRAEQEFTIEGEAGHGARVLAEVYSAATTGSISDSSVSSPASSIETQVCSIGSINRGVGGTSIDRFCYLGGHQDKMMRGQGCSGRASLQKAKSP